MLLFLYTYINIGKTERIIKISRFASNSVENFEGIQSYWSKDIPLLPIVVYYKQGYEDRGTYISLPTNML